MHSAMKRISGHVFQAGGGSLLLRVDYGIAIGVKYRLV